MKIGLNNGCFLEVMVEQEGCVISLSAIVMSPRGVALVTLSSTVAVSALLQGAMSEIAQKMGTFIEQSDFTTEGNARATGTILVKEGNSVETVRDNFLSALTESVQEDLDGYGI